MVSVWLGVTAALNAWAFTLQVLIVGPLIRCA